MKKVSGSYCYSSRWSFSLVDFRLCRCGLCRCGPCYFGLVDDGLYTRFRQLPIFWDVSVLVVGETTLFVHRTCRISG